MKAIILLLFLCSCASVRINGVKVPDKTSTKMDTETVFYLTVSFWLGFGVMNHFIKHNTK